MHEAYRGTHLYRCLVQLHKRDILAQTAPRPIAERYTVLAILLRLLLALQPSLGSEVIRIFAIELPVSLYDPWNKGHLRALGREFTFEHDPAFGYEAREKAFYRWTETQGLLDASDVVRAILRDLFILRHSREVPGSGSLVDLRHDLRVDGRVVHEVVHDGLKSGSGGVGAGKEDEKHLCFDILLVERLTVLRASF